MGAVTLLPRYDRNNGWFETLPEVPPAAPLSGPTEADVVVVGAGFTGLAAARRLAELRPEARILLVEAGSETAPPDDRPASPSTTPTTSAPRASPTRPHTRDSRSP